MKKREDLFAEFHISWQAVNGTYESYARKLGISYSLLQILCELYSSENGLTQKTICDICFLPKTTVNTIILGLENQKYVVLCENPNDRRQKIIRLTDNGKKYAKPIMDHMRNSELDAFNSLDNETREKMITGIQIYQKIFDEKLNKDNGGN